MSCFWTDFVNCFEDCSEGCEPFADVLPAYEYVSTNGSEASGWIEAGIDWEGGTFYVVFPEDSGITSCTITGGTAKMPTSSGDCDAGCCVRCLDGPCIDLTNFGTNGVDYHFDTDGGTDNVSIVSLPETELEQDPDVPTKFSGPIDAVAPGVEDLVGTFVTSINLSTNLGQICDARVSRHSCF